MPTVANYQNPISPACRPESSYHMTQSVITLSATMLGAGILTLPRVFALLGVLYGIIAVYSIALLSAYNLQWLVQCRLESGKRCYKTLVGNYLGSFSARALNVSFIIFLSGTCITNLVVAVDSFPRNMIELDRSSSLLLLSLVAFPFCLCNSISSFNGITVLSLVFRSYIPLFLLCERVASESSTININWYEGPSSLSDTAESLAVLMSSFICHFIIFQVDLKQTESDSSRAITSIYVSHIGVCATIYVISGLSGYLLFGPSVESNVLDSFDSRSDHLKFAKIALSLTNILKIPLLTVPLRDALSKEHSSTFRWRIVSTAMIITLVTGCAIYISDLFTILEVLGSSVGLVVAFIFPIALRISSRNRRESLILEQQPLIQAMP